MVTMVRGNETLVACITVSAVPCTERKSTYSSCKNVTVNNPSAVNTLANLAAGDIFYAGDYKVEVTQASSSGDGWSGEGTVQVTLLNGFALPAQVTFNGIKLNNCYELIGGSLVTKYDPSWSNIADVDDIIKDFREVIGQVENLLGTYKGTPEQVATIQTTILPILAAYPDVPEAVALSQKLDDLSKDCKSPSGTELSDNCKAKVAQIQADYEKLKTVIDDLPPLPVDLFPASSSANGRLAAGDEPDVTITELDEAARGGCSDKKGCKRINFPTVRTYWGQNIHQGSEFWLVESKGKKFFVWRTYYLNQVVYGYLPYEATVGNYTAFRPAQGTTAGAAFADAGQELTFNIAVVMATAGLGEGIASELTESFVNAVAECNGDPELLARNLSEELLFSGLGYVPDALGSAQMKRLLAVYKPDFGNYKNKASNKLKTISTWLGDAYAKAKSLSGNKLEQYQKFFKKVRRPNLIAVYDGIVRFGGKYKGNAFFVATGAKIAIIKKVGNDYILVPEPNKLIATSGVNTPILEELGSVKYQKLDGSQTEGGLVLIDACGLTSAGGRVAAGDCPGPKKLALLAVNRFVKFASPRDWREYLDVNKYCLPNTWSYALGRAGQSFKDVSTKLRTDLLIERDEILSKYGQFGGLPLKIDCFGFPNFLPFVNQATNVLTGGAVLCMVEIDDMEGFGDRDYAKANELLSKKLGLSGVVLFSRTVAKRQF